MKGQPERKLWFRLARDLHMSVARAQQEIDSREFVEWAAFLREEPSAYVQDRWLAAQIVCWLRRMLGGSRARIPDCLLEFAPPQTHDEMEASMRMYAQTHNAMLAQQKKKG